MKSLSLASQTSPENSIHRHCLSSLTSSNITSLVPSSTIDHCQIASPQLQQIATDKSPRPVERQNSCGGSKRFFVSRVQYPVDQQPQQKPSGNGSHRLRIKIEEGQPAAENQAVTAQAPDGGAAENEERQRQQQQQEFVTFRYTWPVRITERLIGTGESAILNVSPAFCTAFNGVQFTWLLRICEEEIFPAEIGDQTEGDTAKDSNDDDELGTAQQQLKRRKVNITLYYKEGPANDVKLYGGNISIRNSEGVLFDNMPVRHLEYTKGGGWSPIGDEVLMSSGGRLRDEQRKFSEFIHDHVGKQITVRVQMKMPASLFQPMQYLPSIESPQSAKLSSLCAIVLDEIRQNKLQVPDVEHFDLKTDKYALYRHVFQFGCSEILSRFLKDPSKFGDGCDEKELLEEIQNIFAHYYFNSVIVREAECFEDFLEALDASRHVQFPALRRECERYICSEVMAEFADLAFVKKMLLLAERFNLSVLKMVSFGVIVDRLLVQETGPNHLPRARGKRAGGGLSRLKDGCTMESMEEIREELLEIAGQIIHPTDHLHNLSYSSPASVSSVGPQRSAAANSLQCPSQRKHSKSLGSPQNSPNESPIGSDDENASDDSDAESDTGGETLVGSVIAQLEELARHIRKVSMPPGVSPAPISNSGELPQTPTTNSPGIVSMDSAMGSVDSRRSSLKTTREHLLLHHPDRICCDSSACAAATMSPCSTAGQSFFAQIYRQPTTDASSVCSTSSSSSEYVPRRQSSIRDRVNSSNIENAMRPPCGRSKVQFMANRNRPISSSCSKLYTKTGVRFEPIGGRHREADEDEGVDLEDQ